MSGEATLAVSLCICENEMHKQCGSIYTQTLNYILTQSDSIFIQVMFGQLGLCQYILEVISARMHL